MLACLHWAICSPQKNIWLHKIKKILTQKNFIVENHETNIKITFLPLALSADNPHQHLYSEWLGAFADQWPVTAGVEIQSFVWTHSPWTYWKEKEKSKWIDSVNHSFYLRVVQFCKQMTKCKANWKRVRKGKNRWQERKRKQTASGNCPATTKGEKNST